MNATDKEFFFSLETKTGNQGPEAANSVGLTDRGDKGGKPWETCSAAKKRWGLFFFFSGGIKESNIFEFANSLLRRSAQSRCFKYETKINKLTTATDSQLWMSPNMRPNLRELLYNTSFIHPKKSKWTILCFSHNVTRNIYSFVFGAIYNRAQWRYVHSFNVYRTFLFALIVFAQIDFKNIFLCTIMHKYPTRFSDDF